METNEPTWALASHIHDDRVLFLTHHVVQFFCSSYVEEPEPTEGHPLSSLALRLFGPQASIVFPVGEEGFFVLSTQCRNVLFLPL